MTILIALGGTAAAAALTWFFCLRPMLNASCCAERSIEEEIRSAKDDLRKLQRVHAGQPAVSITSNPRA
ncbi:hypothetical protein [Parafrigoribacterium mesophilum]|uniref:hypothetical protein n=1 Tax=Parafrigoribacterium mesophilum TaxID=433646 RepID=UPI0031FD9A94